MYIHTKYIIYNVQKIHVWAPKTVTSTFVSYQLNFAYIIFFFFLVCSFILFCFFFKAKNQVYVKYVLYTFADLNAKSLCCCRLLIQN